jgi:tetratricopeptide (TPR) repeat protein
VAAKKRRKPPRPAARTSPASAPARPLAAPPARRPASFVDALSEAEALITRRRWNEAAGLLEELAERYPSEPMLHGRLAEAYLECGNTPGVERAAQRLVELQPDEPAALGMLGGAHLASAHPALATRAFRRLLERWPEDPSAPEVRKQLGEIEPALGAALRELGLSGERAIEIAAQHEMVQALLGQGQYHSARRAAEDLARQAPDFVPALNNLSLAESADGALEQAIRTAKRISERWPENVHALGNLIHFLCLAGRFEEAARWVPALRAAPASRMDDRAKQAEALSYLGDDARVLEVLEETRDEGTPGESEAAALVYHLAAVAAMRQGDENGARGYWKQALRIDPTLELARENLEDLRKPIGERHAPWPFAMPNWIPASALADVLERFGRFLDRPHADDEGLAIVARRVARDHAELAGIVPALLDRGDPPARQLAVMLATMLHRPETDAALRDFALGLRGPDELRHQAARAAVEAGLIAGGPVRFWIQGDWREILLVNFEVDGEPIARHGPRVHQLAMGAQKALRESRGHDAEQMLNEALALEPDKPDLLNNLAVAYQVQGRIGEHDELVRRIFSEHPDYLFARVGIAMLAIDEGRIDEARELLLPLLERERFHYSEFATLARAQIELLLADGHPEGARSWLAMWEEMDPDHPMLEAAQRRVRRASPAARLKRSLSFPGRSGRSRRPAA